MVSELRLVPFFFLRRSRSEEDNPINQTILSTFMKKKKIKYDVAKNGEEAVQKWKSGTFHLILVSSLCLLPGLWLTSTR